MVGLRAEAAPSALAPTLNNARGLQLEVFVNDRPTGLIATFEQDASGAFSATRSELSEVGVKAPGAGPPGEKIRLSSIAGLTFVYDEPNQTMRLTAAASIREAKEYGEKRDSDKPELRRGFGGVVNYDLYTSGLRPLGSGRATYQGYSATLDGRFFSQFGTFSQSGIIGTTIASQSKALRLDTTWFYSDPESLRVYRAGDFVSSGLAWTRPVRVGGVQIQRNFSLRPDLVTLPMPVISGSAAVPSALDVYVNNVKTFSQNIGDGPYRVANLPIVGSGDAKVVLHDSTGREIEQNVPFYTSPLLLRPGFMDYSVEVGAPRSFYGTGSDRYESKIIGNASLRRGIQDWLTVEAHLEGAAKLANGGIGVDARVLDRGIVSAAVSASRYGGRTGFQLYSSAETRIGSITLSASSQRTIGKYADVAAATATDATGLLASYLASGASLDPFSLLTSARPPRAVDRLSVSVPVPLDKANLTFSGTRIVNADNSHTTIGSASWSRSGPFNSSLYATAFVNVAGYRTLGLFGGLSVPLGPKIYASTGVARNGGKLVATTEVSRSLERTDGSYGWRVRDVEGNGATVSRSAQASYRSPWGSIEGVAAQEGRNARGSLEATGSIAALGGGVFVGNRIDDAFAVVDAGAPNVEVLHDNRPVGKTDSRGKLLVPDLRSFQRNNLSIDVRNLPLDADASMTQQSVAPTDRGGAVVNFGVKKEVRGAVVILVGADGKPLPAGSQGRLAGAGATFVVGYDGRAYITDLAARNEARVSVNLGECAAQFDYAPSPGGQVVVGPVPCR